MLTLNDGRSELWQWDTGRTLAVDADCSQVHFSNKVFGRSIDVDVIDGASIIPDILLQTDKDLNVWAFVGTAENGYTKISKTFKVNRRNKPADYVFTPPDQTTLSELEERLDRIEESQDPDAIKNAVDDYLKQNPVEVPVQSVNGQTGAVELTAEDVGAIAKTELPTAINTALAQAKASGEFDGADGVPGKDGADGKSAYAYAVDGGYTGTEAEFAEKMAQEIPTIDPTLTQSGQAADAATVGERLSALSDEITNLPSGGSGKTALDAFIDNTDIDYLYDETTGAYYTVIRVYKQKLDGSYQYPFVYAPNGTGAGDKSTYDMTVTDGWLLAINSGIFNTSTKKPDGIVIQNGVVVQNAPSTTHSQCKPLTIDSNGDLGYAAYDADAKELVASGIVSAVCGFMPIVVDYAAVDSSEWNSVSHYTENTQRQIIGQWGNGDYAIITCEGRGYHNSDGWTIAEAQAICIKHGLKFAYNLDGGGSTETMLGLKHINTIYENITGRIVPTFIVFNGSSDTDTDVDNDGSNEFIIVIGIGIELVGTSGVINTPQATRMSAVNTANIPKLPAKNGTGATNYAPIKIPDGATKVTVTCNGFYPGISLWVTDGNTWARTVDAGWGTFNGMTYTLPDGEYTHYTINFKNSSAGTITADTDTSGISIVFE